jgi:hypothetical protein
MSEDTRTDSENDGSPVMWLADDEVVVVDVDHYGDWIDVPECRCGDPAWAATESSGRQAASTAPDDVSFVVG